MTYHRVVLSHRPITALLGAMLMLMAAYGCDNRPTESKQQTPAGAMLAPHTTPRAPGDCDRTTVWAKMSSTVRTLWETLGWDKTSWDGEAPAPASEGTAWSNLSLEQRGAAVKLGCQPTNWNATRSRDDPPS